MANNRTLEAIVSIAGQLDPSLQRSLSSATKQFSGLKIGVAAVGTAAVAATAAFVKFGADAVKSAAAFEQQMANVSSLLDGSAEEIAARTQELSKDVLAVSNATGVSSDELSDGLYKIISAVGDSADAITQMELAAKVAKAGGAETTQAIDLLTAVTKGYNDTSGEAFQKAADLAFMTDKLGQTSVPELASSIGKVIPLSAALGVEQEELFGAFAALTGVTGSTAEVATQMKAVMSGLMSPTDDMTKAMESLGYANANAALESLGFQGMLEALGGTVNGDIQSLAKLFSSVEAQTAILALAGAQTEDLREKTAAMYDAGGAMSSAFDMRTDTFENTIAVIKNLGKNFVTNIGMKILPVVKDVAEKLLPVIQTGLDNLSPVLEGMYQAASPVIGTVGDFIGGILPRMQGGLEGITGVWQLLGPEISKIAEQVMPVFGQVFGEVCAMFESIAPTISTFVSNLLPAISSLLIGLMPIIQVLATALAPIISMIGQVVNALLPALTSLINFLVPIISALAQVLSFTLGGTLNYLLPIVQNIINVFTGLMDFITNVFTANWSGAWDSVCSIFANTFQVLKELPKMSINSILAQINGLISGINGLGLDIPEWVPVLGGKKFSINLPEIPMLASGGFTNGPSIAGEAGTEAVISFNNAYRDENLSYWAKAGRMLGVDDSLLTAFEKRGSGSGGMNITFAPQITINSSGRTTEQDIINALKDEEIRFMQMLEEMMDRRGGESYGFNF